MNAIKFQNMIRRALLEEVERRSSTGEGTTAYQRVPEVTHGEDLKKIVPHERDSRTKDEILDDITKATKAIDPSIVVVWDDHDDISVSARDMFRVRISPRWENSYNIEAMIRNEDRIYVTNQTLEQVIEFLKINLKNATTATEKAWNKSKENEDMKNDETTAPDKGLNQKDKPAIKPLTNEPIRTAKSKDKNYTEPQTKEEADLPEKPMREPGKLEKQIDHKSKSAISLRHEKTKFPEKKPNTQLSVKIPQQDTSKWRKK
jgi:hypothetical protein